MNNEIELYNRAALKYQLKYKFSTCVENAVCIYTHIVTIDVYAVSRYITFQPVNVQWPAVYHRRCSKFDDSGEK